VKTNLPVKLLKNVHQSQKKSLKDGKTFLDLFPKMSKDSRISSEEKRANPLRREMFPQVNLLNKANLSLERSRKKPKKFQAIFLKASEALRTKSDIKSEKLNSALKVSPTSLLDVLKKHQLT